ncbi:hypothetical protein [Neobacillus sp. SAB-20_R2A]|uniref:hypothetical protein n=1 Tax=Neobacillus sp. SAB-20_R2A TaxID=3120519 RepID=UPI003C6E2121
MKKETLLAVFAFFMVSLSAITVVYAIEEKAKVITISKEEEDITGDGKNEVIQLKGEPYQDDENSYLKEIFIEINTSDGKTTTIPLESGAKAALQLADINHDSVKDVFATVYTGGSGGIVDTFLYTLKDFQKKDLTASEPLDMETHFLDGYKAEIKINATGKSYLFDLRDRKDYYKKMGLYRKGKLNEPTELMVNPFNSLEPIQLDGGKLGLKGIQRVTGIANADTIAFVESIWTYSDGKWKLVKVEVKKEEV